MPCSREATLDGYCAQHHPSAEEERRKARERRMERASQCSELRVEVGCLRRDVIIAAQEMVKMNPFIPETFVAFEHLRGRVERLIEVEGQLDRLIKEPPCGTTSIP